MSEADAAIEPLRGSRPGVRGETEATVRWERATYWPLTAVAFAFVIAYTFQVIGDLEGPWSTACGAVVVGSWALFIVDYVVRLAMSHPRGRWFRHHLFDLAVVFIPTLRPVRLLGAITRLATFTQTAGASLRARMLVYGSGSALLLIWQASLAVLAAERDAAGATITNFGDAVWWAFCTVTTVGYGDYTPVTVRGRVVAVMLMIGGVVLVGLITATFASWVTERVTRGHEERRPATRADVAEVLHAMEARTSSPAGDDPAR
jgi:voltage-gated potassium channel